MNNFYKKDFGFIGELTAGEFIEEMGFNILERNFRFGKLGEIDIIAIKGNLLVFFEVKTRRSHVHGGALYSMPPKRRERFKLVAGKYLYISSHIHNPNLVFRYDMIAVENGSISWIKDMFR